MKADYHHQSELDALICHICVMHLSLEKKGCGNSPRKCYKRQDAADEQDEGMRQGGRVFTEDEEGDKDEFVGGSHK